MSKSKSTGVAKMSDCDGVNGESSGVQRWSSILYRLSCICRCVQTGHLRARAAIDISHESRHSIGCGQMLFVLVTRCGRMQQSREICSHF